MTDDHAEQLIRQRKDGDGKPVTIMCRYEGGPHDGREEPSWTWSFPTIAPHGIHATNRRCFLARDGEILIHPDRMIGGEISEYCRIGPRVIPAANAVTVWRFVRIMDDAAVAIYLKKQERRMRRLLDA